MTDRSVRSLLHLESSASTSRVLNLHRVSRQRGDGVREPDRVLFNHPLLDRSIVIKHRLRRDEADLFHGPRAAATKVIIPVDMRDLRMGGMSFFVGQRNGEALLRASFGPNFVESRDFEVLKALDATPSLDPFLLRERLKTLGVNPGREYLEISEADTRQMQRFVETEIEPLVRLSLGGAITQKQSSRLAAKILSSEPGEDLEPLRHTLRLDAKDYAEGVFCWRGFLFYKWKLAAILPEVRATAAGIETVRPYGEQDMISREYLRRSRGVLRRSIQGACAAAEKTLRVYDDAYANLVERGQPDAFRDFLLAAPQLFRALGERLGFVSHMVSYWSYRFPPGDKSSVSVAELQDIFMEFETGLNVADFTAEPAPAPVTEI